MEYERATSVAKSRGNTRFKANHDCLLRQKYHEIRNQEKDTTDTW